MRPLLTPFAIAAALFVQVGQSEEKLSFNRDIRPILSDKCFHCHGPDKNTREADIRLDTREGALAEESIVPGDLKGSEVYWRINSDDEDELMPPPDSNKHLSKAERELIARWIEEGAEYEAHWAYLPVEKGAASRSIDELVEERLSSEGLKRSTPAEPLTLLRRLHFDITGIPPTVEDAKRFGETGLEEYVDELLTSPHFGERMAIEWLDAVRYADTVGYHGDQLIEVSAYRDWVINAFNANMRFDQFTIEQIAGDLLPGATLQQKVAAVFNRLGQSSEEGGIQDAEYLAKYQAERVRTTTTTWMGATLACAECHDHKFDPYTTKDFYQFAAFFADILEKGAWTGDGSYQEDIKPFEASGMKFGKRGPILSVPDDEEAEQVKALEEKLAEERARFKVTTPELEAAARGWAAEQRALMQKGGPVDYVIISERGEKRNIDTKGWAFVGPDKGEVFDGGVSRLQEGKELIQHIGKGKGEPLDISDGDSLYAYVFLDPANPPSQVMLQFHHAKGGWSHRAWWGKDDISFGKGTEGPSHFRAGDLPEAGKWVRLEVGVKDLGLKTGDQLSQFAFTQFGGKVWWDQSGLSTENEKYQWGDFSESLGGILSKTEADWTAAEEKEILEHYRTVAPELASIRKAVHRDEGALAALRSGIRTLPATVSAKRREIRILARGNWMDKSGEVVQPGTPHFLPSHEEGALTRLDLAQWLVSDKNPLTSRTFVNRLWARFFGKGISSAPEDLGSQGGWPTHPELLDSLAAGFVESGWDMKALVKRIVLSETYQQSSKSTPSLQERDPYNRLLARQTGIRLPAELVRDNALAVSGLLNPAIGGRSAHPYQPADYYQHLNFPKRTYQADMNDEQYRRGVYTHWQRTFLHPAMRAFDAPSREECSVKRDISSTPLQALVLLNDPTFVEAAKALAVSSKAIPEMFQRVLTREAEPEELSALTKLYDAELERFKAEPNYADGLLEVGMKEIPAEVNRIELAARTSVARSILNLQEVITRY
ncbi:PSD1 and planctomycete cytochrome C domain-containing protein [Verrucomicrobiales bacterium BCK34]|nr:PSD1 and planctomycete cytochrome C domain-containing protein [Verrucomicrobiales bacterium BCK34]